MTAGVAAAASAEPAGARGAERVGEAVVSRHGAGGEHGAARRRVRRTGLGLGVDGKPPARVGHLGAVRRHEQRLALDDCLCLEPAGKAHGGAKLKDCRHARAAARRARLRALRATRGNARAWVGGGGSRRGAPARAVLRGRAEDRVPAPNPDVAAASAASERGDAVGPLAMHAGEDTQAGRAMAEV